MRVTASHIVNWANNHAKEAQVSLPRWVRRLCFDIEATRQFSFPAGDSTYVPGWDGALHSDKGDAWVPAGESRWEIGCDQNVKGKANDDYKKRVAQMSKEERSVCSFVFVTPRRWIKKSAWLAEKRKKCEWMDVYAYDADDLEQWLEQTPAVALQFAEELGLNGWGVLSLSQYWKLWAGQCSPAITPEGLFIDRNSILESLTEKIQSPSNNSNSTGLLVIRADSVEEAVAFAVAVIMATGDLQDHALVVTEPIGWRYVEANPQLKTVIAARTEISCSPVMRLGLKVVVPHAIGDLVGKPEGDHLILERPNIYEFKKALISIGMEESDAGRYASITGRSWTVLRRHRAINPAIQRPAWLETPQASNLSLLCLLGAWCSSKDSDRQVVERLANQPYEKIDREFRQLLQLDDAPLLKIGSIWKAKSPLELFSQCGDQITSSQLDRFFSIAQEMLSIPDPQLELKSEERWMAQVRGKVHLHSGLLFESVCDSLMKLAVRGIECPGLSALNIEERVSEFIHVLLHNADEERWLSLASFLPTLAEAAPNEFLNAVQKSLQTPSMAVARLITESSDSRCWHSGLLWALEILAWSPRRLAQVAITLAQLSHIPIKSNWGNKPSASLLGLFRPWLPQTAASLPERIEVLNLLIRKDSEVAFDLLIRLSSRDSDIAFPANRPKWRDDDAGAGRGCAYAEINEMLVFVKGKLLLLCERSSLRIVSLLEKTMFRELIELPSVFPLIEYFIDPNTPDNDRETLSRTIRDIIHWHRNYDDMPTVDLNEKLEPLEAYYGQLAPQDPVVRHRWLFNSHWLDLPVRIRDENINEKSSIIKQLRISALDDIYEECRIDGINNLIASCGEPYIVGTLLTEATWDITWAEWIFRSFPLCKHTTSCIIGFLQAISLDVSIELLKELISLGKYHKWSSNDFAGLLILAQPGRKIWELSEECGQEVFDIYWQTVTPYSWRDDEDIDYVLEQLLKVKRPLTALQYCQHALKKTSPHVLLSALKQLLDGEETSGPQIAFWHLEKMLERLEKSDEIEKMALIQLEFGLFPMLGYGEKTKADALFNGIMSEPELFKELICLLYKPENGEREEPITEATCAAAERSWKILHACKRVPGTQSDGSINGSTLNQFINSVRDLCLRADRLTMCDQTLGQILAHSPTEEDNLWPANPIKEMLDQHEMENMRIGFCIGTFNKRGVTSRSPLEGGNQERDLAKYYKDQAVRVQCSYPNVSAMLEKIAKKYEYDGKHEDIEANLNKESF